MDLFPVVTHSSEPKQVLFGPILSQADDPDVAARWVGKNLELELEARILVLIWPLTIVVVNGHLLHLSLFFVLKMGLACILTVALLLLSKGYLMLGLQRRCT